MIPPADERRPEEGTADASNTVKSSLPQPVVNSTRASEPVDWAALSAQGAAAPIIEDEDEGSFDPPILTVVPDPPEPQPGPDPEPVPEETFFGSPLWLDADARDGLPPGTWFKRYQAWLKTAGGKAQEREERVFGMSPVMEWIRVYARHCMVSPWALLGVSITHALAEIPPSLRGPAFVGGPFSLNFFTALVGPSGSGKSAALSAFDATMLPGESVECLTPSSGEGVVTLFVEVDRDGKQTQVRTCVLSRVDEIATLGGMQGRSGSTLAPILRSIWSGSAVGQNGAEAQRRRNLKAHSYRFCMVTGVQPSTAPILLDDHGAGTPQRFLWMPATDSRADPDAPEPGPLPSIPVLPPAALRRAGALIEFPDHVGRFVRLNQAAVVRGGRAAKDALDGHSMLTRLKVASGLAVLHGTTVVSEDMWNVSELIMEVSDAVRGELVQYQVDVAKEARKELGRSDVAREDAAVEARARRAAQVVGRAVQASTEQPVKRRALSDALGRDKDILDEAIKGAITFLWITQAEVERGDGSKRTATVYSPGDVKVR